MLLDLLALSRLGLAISAAFGWPRLARLIAHALLLKRRLPLRHPAILSRLLTIHARPSRSFALCGASRLNLLALFDSRLQSGLTLLLRSGTLQL